MVVFIFFFLFFTKNNSRLYFIRLERFCLTSPRIFAYTCSLNLRKFSGPASSSHRDDSGCVLLHGWRFYSSISVGLLFFFLLCCRNLSILGCCLTIFCPLAFNVAGWVSAASTVATRGFRHLPW